MDDHWIGRFELVTILKEGAVISLAKAGDGDGAEDDYDEEEFSTTADTAQVVRLSSQAARACRMAKATESATLGPVVSFISRLSRASVGAVATNGPPRFFVPLKLF